MFFDSSFANKISDSVEFRFAVKFDLDNILSFYQRWGSSKRSLFTNKQLFCHEFLCADKLNCLLAVDKSSSNILSSVCFYNYDVSSLSPHISPSISRVSRECKVPYLGIYSLYLLKKLTNCSSYYGVNVNSRTMAPLVKKFLHHRVSTLNHFFMINTAISSYRIIKPCPGEYFEANLMPPTSSSLEPIHTSDEFSSFYSKISLDCRVPYKSFDFIKRRYFESPIYRYLPFALKSSGSIFAIVLLREQFACSSSCLRLVDYFGSFDYLPLLSQHLKMLLLSSSHEFLDIESTLPFEFFADSMFSDKSKSNIIIPSHYQPYSPDNKEIFFETNSNLYFFRGDADGDRPRL